MALHFEKEDIPLQKRMSSGVKGMNIDEDDEIILAKQISKGGEITIITDGGFAKKVNIAEFGLSARYRKGLRAISLGDISKRVVYASFGENEEKVVMITTDGIKLANNFPISNRISEGKKIVEAKVVDAYSYKE